MSEQNNGGPAFPLGDADGRVTQEGMTLRDWFAGQALAGHLASQSRDIGFYQGSDSFEKMASDAYRTADAMLKQREEGGSNE